MGIVGTGGVGGRQHTAPTIRMELVVDGGNVVVVVDGDLDLTAVERLQAVVGAMIDVPGIDRVEIDGARVGFADSAGMGGLLRSRADAYAAGVSWYLGAASEPLQRMLLLAGIGSLLGDPAVN